jgi:hypothetical protein
VKVDTATDLDVLTRLMQAKQTCVAAERTLDAAKESVKQTAEHMALLEAKAQHKLAKTAVNMLLDELEPHVMRRRDDLNMPKFPGLNNTDT